MIKRIIKGLKRRLKGQSIADAEKEWLIEHGLRIGEKVSCFNWTGIDSIYPGLITLGNEVTIAPGCRILAHDASTCIPCDATRIGVVEIGDHCFIGADTTVLPNVRIGEWCIIGAGSVVTTDIPPRSIAAGNPARVISTMDAFIEKHEKNLRTHFVSLRPWQEWPNATQEEWAQLREACANTYGYVTTRKDL